MNLSALTLLSFMLMMTMGSIPTVNATKLRGVKRRIQYEGKITKGESRIVRTEGNKKEDCGVTKDGKPLSSSSNVTKVMRVIDDPTVEDDPNYAAGYQAADADTGEALLNGPTTCEPCAASGLCNRNITEHVIVNPSADRYLVGKINEQNVYAVGPGDSVSYAINNETFNDCFQIMLWDGPTGSVLGAYWGHPGYIPNEDETPYVTLNSPNDGDITVQTGGIWPTTAGGV